MPVLLVWSRFDFFFSDALLKLWCYIIDEDFEDQGATAMVLRHSFGDLIYFQTVVCYNASYILPE